MGRALWILAVLAQPALASADDVQGWVVSTLQKPVADGWVAAIEFQPRFSENISDLGVFIVRPSITRQVGERLTLTGGYLWQRAFEPTRHEQRLWQQAVVTARHGRWSFAQRTRLEQRFFEGSDRPSLRLRVRLQGLVQVRQATDWHLLLGQEVNWTLNRARLAPPTGFQGGRTTLGLSRRIGRLSFEPAYVLQVVRHDERANDITHILQVSTTARF